MIKRDELRIRDPFIYTDKKQGCYYMYGTTALEDSSIRSMPSFSCYKSYDLESFEGPFEIFNGEKYGFWADRDYWAAELHEYNGRYYLFATFRSEQRCKGCQILTCDTPDGRFVPTSLLPVTPAEWNCLDGTLYVENGVPYMIFCHEFSQTVDGEICAVQLSDDLSSSVGEPRLLFRASQSPYSTEIHKDTGKLVTDGPFLWSEDGKVKMIWSTFYHGLYVILPAESDSLFGEWRHGEPLFDFSGGHAMFFDALDGRRMLSFHGPNILDRERALFYEYQRRGGALC